MVKLRTSACICTTNNSYLVSMDKTMQPFKHKKGRVYLAKKGKI